MWHEGSRFELLLILMDNVVYSEDTGFLKDSVRAMYWNNFHFTCYVQSLKTTEQRTEIIGSVLTKDFTILWV